MQTSFAAGSLPIISYARPGKLFTANTGLMVAQAGILMPDTLKQIIEAAVVVLRAGLAV